MVKYKVILDAGEKLRNSDIKTISTPSLFQFMRDATGSHRNETIKHYLVLLKNANYIRPDYGCWIIVR